MSIDDLHGGSAHHTDFTVPMEELTDLKKYAFFAVVAISITLFAMTLVKMIHEEKDEKIRRKDQ